MSIWIRFRDFVRRWEIINLGLQLVKHARVRKSYARVFQDSCEWLEIDYNETQAKLTEWSMLKGEADHASSLLER